VTKETYLEKKQHLVNQVLVLLNNIELNFQDKSSLNLILRLLDDYTYENRLQKKGLLSHTIIDSMELNYDIGEKIIKFDNDIK